jgi:hypothetical protein
MADARIPSELPEKPDGWTKRMEQHLNFGREGGVGLYSIHDADGNRTPIGWQYDTRKGGLTGFTMRDVEGVMTWAELRVKWATGSPA